MVADGCPRERSRGSGSSHFDEPAVAQARKELLDLALESGGHVVKLASHAGQQFVEGRRTLQQPPDKRPDRIDAVVRAGVELEQDSSSIAAQLVECDPWAAPEHGRPSDIRHRRRSYTMLHDVCTRSSTEREA